MVGINRTSSEENDEVAEFFAHFYKYAVEATRRAPGKRPGKRPDREPNQKEIAEVLGQSPSTVGRWRKQENFPREELIASVLDLAGAGQSEQTRFLAIQRRARLLWNARAAATRDSAGVTPVDVKMYDTVDTDAHGIGSLTYAGLDKTADIVRDINEEFKPGPPEEGCPDMTVSTQSRADERHCPSPGDATDLGSAPEDDAAIRLAKAADALAKKLRVQWDDEAADRGLDIPPPIPPRWIRTSRPVAGPVRVAVGDPPHRTRFPPLPGTGEATAKAVEGGGLGELYDVYAGLGSGRIVLMGHYGSGKTATAILLLLDALDRRVRLRPSEATRTPVPVLLTAREWDPRRHSLADWFTQQLVTVYDFLKSPEYGPDPAGELIRNGRVSLLLDGFDEMDRPRQAEALLHINRQPRTFRLVVLARLDNFTTVVQAERLSLHGAVALELTPVSCDQAIRYLEDHQPFPLHDDDQMKKLINHLRQHPDDPVSQALDTPLNLTLIREDPHAADELLKPGLFHTREEAEEYLLGRVVPTAYGPGRPPGPPSEQARKWLGYLATKMGDNDLAWWQMHHWAPIWERCLFNTLAGMILMSCIGTLLFGPIGQYTVTGHTGVLFGAVYGAGMGAFFGLLATLVSELREPRPGWGHRLRTAFRGRLARLAHRLPRFAFNSAVGLTILVVVTMAVGNQSSYLFGLPAGIIAACASGYAATRVRPTSSTRSWWGRLRPNVTGLLAATAVGLPIGLSYGLTKTPLHGTVAGLMTGFAFGLMVSVIRPIADTDTPPTPDMRWRRDRQRALLVALSAAIPLSLAMGFQNGRAHGVLAGSVTALGFGTIITLGSIAAISDIWRTTLLFAQLRLRGVFPLRGMRFLNGARTRHVLRTAGPRFQFKHARLRTTLAKGYQSSSPHRADYRTSRKPK